MKHTKTTVSLLLVLVMVLALTATAFAAEPPASPANTGSITVQNPQKDQTYKAYKIFDVVYDKNQDGTVGTHYDYTIDSSNTWFTTVQAYATETNGLKLDQVAGTTTYIVSVTNSFSAAAFAVQLKEALDADQAKPTAEQTLVGTELTQSATDTSVVTATVPLGYYFVTSTLGSLCNLTTTNPHAIIYDKNVAPEFNKVDDKEGAGESVEIGETVNYTITGQVPNTTGYATYDYVITDTMSTGLTFNKDITIYISDDDTLDTATDRPLNAAYYTKTEENAKAFDNTTNVTFNITFKAIDMNKATPDSLAGKYIIIIYTATVNQDAAGEILNNKAILTYSNNPSDSTKHGTVEKKQTVYSAKIVIDKYAKQTELVNGEEDTSKKLSGATFILYRYALRNTTDNTYSFADAAGHSYTADSVAPAGSTLVKRYYKYIEATATDAALVQWVGEEDSTKTSHTTENGVANFIGLEDGTYYLEETAAPAGYNKLTGPVTITIKGTNNENKLDKTLLTHTEKVGNNTGTLLPDTGGIGTTIFYVVGSVLFVGAAVLLITKRRMRAE